MDILYDVGDTKGGIKGRGYCQGYIVSGRGYQGWSKGERVLLKVYCIVSRIPRVV